MVVKFLLPQTDQDARQMVVKFKNDGFAPLTAEGIHFGFVRQVGEKNKVMIIADVTDPELVKSIKERTGEDESLEIELDSK